jgi:hypothetical protein
MYCAPSRGVVRVLIPTAVLVLLTTGPANAQRGCRGMQQGGQSSMRAQFYASQAPYALQSQQYAGRQYAPQQNALQQYALQQYALQQAILQAQQNALQQYAFMAQVGALAPAEALQLQLSAVQQAALQQQYGAWTQAQLQAALAAQQPAGQKRSGDR